MSGSDRLGPSVRRGAGTTLSVLLVSVLLAACATTMDRSELATEYYNLGAAFFDLGDLERSADYFSRALEFDASLARASYNLARVYVLQGRFSDAESLLVELRDQEPENTIVLETLAYVAYSRGDLETAGSIYDDVLEIDPGSVNALYNRAIIAAENDEGDLAASLLREAHSIDDRDKAILNLLASVEDQLGNVDSAIAALESLKDLGAAGSESMLLLAELYQKSQRFDLALDELDNLVAGSDDAGATAEAQFQRGRILLTAAQETEAGLAALDAAFAAGFSDRDRIGDLRASEAMTASAELDELLSRHNLLSDGEQPVGIDGPEPVGPVPPADAPTDE